MYTFLSSTETLYFVTQPNSNTLLLRLLFAPANHALVRRRFVLAGNDRSGAAVELHDIALGIFLLDLLLGRCPLGRRAPRPAVIGQQGLTTLLRVYQ